MNEKFQAIEKILDEKKTKLRQNFYNSVPIERIKDTEIVSYLDAIYSILKSLEDRIITIETHLQTDK